MIKNVGKRFLSIALVIVMVLSLLPVIQMSASAVKEIDVGVSGLAASLEVGEENCTYELGAGSVKVSVTGTGTTGCESSTTDTIIFTNNKSAAAVLSFNYTLALNDGTITIDGKNATAAGSFSNTVAAGSSVKIVLTSAKAAKTTMISITGISLVIDGNVTMTFLPGEGGTYKVDGQTITASTSLTKPTTSGFELVATPASGNKLLGWKSADGNYLSFSATWNMKLDTAQTIQPVFMSESTPVFEVNNQVFTGLNEAVNYAQTNNQKYIILISNGTLPAGNYTIPNGKTLLIPFDEAKTVYTTVPEVVYGSHATPSVFRTLTMAQGANITVASGGAISVPSKLSATGTGAGSWNGTPTGKYGHIKMAEGSSITVQNGGGLYCYGYISGSGSVHALSGSTVWEAMQFRCWRGGSATSGMLSGVFPMSQYYIQNIEASLTLDAGAKEMVYTSVNTGSGAHPASAMFIGSEGMFRINSGSVTKHFDGPTDRLIVDLSGNASISPLELSLNGIDMATKNYVLPINSNITINIHSGTTTIADNQDVAFLPGSVLTVNQGANVSITGSSIYVYDQDQWGNYAATDKKLVVVGYSVANGTATKRTEASLVDARIDVNGTVTVSGSLYTTSGGAAIVSTTGTGKIILNKKAPSDANTQQATQSGTSITKVDIPVTAAQLQNADGSYVQTRNKPANTEIPYVNGKWAVDATPITVKFDANGGSGSMANMTVLPGDTITIPDSTFTAPAGKEFSGWTSSLMAGVVLKAGDPFTIPEGLPFTEITLKASWEDNIRTVTWVNWDGTKLDSKEVNAGTEVNAAEAYTGEIPTRASDEYSYSFIGWDQESAVVNDDVTFTAKFDSIPDQYFTVNLSYRVDNNDEYALTLAPPPFEATKSVRLTAENEHTVNGTTYYFSHWEFDGVEYPAHTVTIHPGKGGPESDPYVVDAYAVYTTEQKTEFPPFVIITKDNMVGLNRVVTLSYSLTDGGKVKEEGVGFNVMLDGNLIGGAASQKLQNTSTGTYTVTIKNPIEGINVKGFVKYQINGADAITLETK